MLADGILGYYPDTYNVNVSITEKIVKNGRKPVKKHVYWNVYDSVSASGEAKFAIKSDNVNVRISGSIRKALSSMVMPGDKKLLEHLKRAARFYGYFIKAYDDVDKFIHAWIMLEAWKCFYGYHHGLKANPNCVCGSKQRVSHKECICLSIKDLCQELFEGAISSDSCVDKNTKFYKIYNARNRIFHEADESEAKKVLGDLNQCINSILKEVKRNIGELINPS
ncbi:hypothetical protein ACAM_0453 [Aeropyrum camini SY1 = JCM 12091]|uniref:Uncharacterized protein n=1 Tax=Aeropyrum camini SY1 = JCM 12091 TaxID=1198449 RepID=U3T8R9_9CREN|nr:hypothetical protein ACAM_0453 [Aeropyrum camini SY1 = JCM 12091]